MRLARFQLRYGAIHSRSYCLSLYSLICFFAPGLLENEHAEGEIQATLPLQNGIIRFHLGMIASVAIDPGHLPQL